MKRKFAIFLLLALLAALILPVQAESGLGYVTDAAGILSDQEWAALEERCAGISRQYGCGVYIITVDDFRNYGSGDVFETTYGIYHDYELGLGADRDGLVLLLSMAQRDCWKRLEEVFFTERHWDCVDTMSIAKYQAITASCYFPPAELQRRTI